MRAVLLLLVLVGLAESGWGQEVSHDTICICPDTFVRVKNYYIKYTDTFNSQNQSDVQLYKKCDYLILGLFHFLPGLNYFKIQNKRLDKEYRYVCYELNAFISIKNIEFGGTFRIDKDYDKYEGPTNALFRDLGYSEDDPQIAVLDYQSLFAGYRKKITRNFTLSSRLEYNNFYYDIRTNGLGNNPLILKSRIEDISFGFYAQKYFKTSENDFFTLSTGLKYNFRNMEKIHADLKNNFYELRFSIGMSIIGQNSYFKSL